MDGETDPVTTFGAAEGFITLMTRLHHTEGPSSGDERPGHENHARQPMSTTDSESDSERMFAYGADYYPHNQADGKTVGCPLAQAERRGEGLIAKAYDDIVWQNHNGKGLIPESEAKEAWSKTISTLESEGANTAADEARGVARDLGWDDILEDEDG